jgi:hypothetical protein
LVCEQDITVEPACPKRVDAFDVALQMPFKATDGESDGSASPSSLKMNAGEILWHGFMKSAIQTTLWRERGKALLRIKRLWPLAEKGQGN